MTGEQAINQLIELIKTLADIQKVMGEAVIVIDKRVSELERRNK